MYTTYVDASNNESTSHALTHPWGGVMILGIRILGVLKVEKSNELIIVILYW